MTVSALICDDLPEERANLIRSLRVYEQTHNVELQLETASDGTELLSMWKPLRWDVIFLDIYMPRLNGIDAARKLRRQDTNCEIIFVTSSRKHGLEGYELRALDYLTKPISQQDVDSALDWFFRKREEKRPELTVKTAEGEERIFLRDIRFIESRGHTCDIHAVDRVVNVRRSINEFASGFGDALFRCHKSFLLNLSHVARLEKNRFFMDDGGSVPISGAKLSESKSALLIWRAEMK